MSMYALKVLDFVVFIVIIPLLKFVIMESCALMDMDYVVVDAIN